MTPRRPTEKAKAFEEALVEDGAKLRGVGLESLGYYGDEEGEPFYDTEEERAAAERKARLIAGCIWRCSGQLVAALFDDVYELRRLEHRFMDDDRLAFIANDSQVLHRLPPAYAVHYTVDFAQKFLVVAADMTARLAGGWSSPSCLAQELAINSLAGMVDTYARDHGLDLDDDIPGTIFEALLEDTDHLFLYEADDRDGGTLDRARVAALDALGAASMEFDDWFQPFTHGRNVAPYAYAAGAPL